MKKFSPLGRQKFESSLGDIFGEISCAQYCLSKLRPKVRTCLLTIAAGEAIHPEIVRMQMGVFVKSAAMRAEVFTKPEKSKGLRIQSSEVHIGAPGVGKGMGSQWGDMIMARSRQMAREYLNTESNHILNGVEEARGHAENGHNEDAVEGNDGGGPENGNNLQPLQVNAEGDNAMNQNAGEENGEMHNPEVDVLQGDGGGDVDIVQGPNERDAGGDADIVQGPNEHVPVQQVDGMVNEKRKVLTFKDLDGIRKVADLPLPGLLKLPTGSCEAVLLRVSRNNGFGYVPINEYIRDRQTILDKKGTNGLFLNSHDGNMEALVYKTTVSVPEMPENNMF